MQYRNLDRPQWHVYPEQGLLNDPNGLVYFKGKYHVYYQYNFRDTTHRFKAWGHRTSSDLLTWSEEDIPLVPSEWYDKDGCYSGGAFVKDDCLYLFYTGTVMEEDGSKSSYQCLATSTDGYHLVKQGPILPHPEGYTRHVRDPQVFQGTNGRYYMLLGAQTNDLRGTTLTYQSDDLHTWRLMGETVPSVSLDSYMWECPNLVRLDEYDYFIFSPQGLPKEAERFRNVFSTTYYAGRFDEETGCFTPFTPLEELDKGFDFYAPQVFKGPQDESIMFGWAGVPTPEEESAIPTIAKGWVHTLTAARLLKEKEKRLVALPVIPNQLKTLSEEKNSCVIISQCSGAIRIMPQKEEWRVVSEAWQLSYRDQTLTLERQNWYTKQPEYRVVYRGKIVELLITLDKNIGELYINDGNVVATFKFFTDKKNISINYI
ncbi:glycoside hydrolase family 32 protein [Vagococcus lutrae]|uniref:glycoside hydrolase family 32 protein n=1 Tax=Vagococcus lutrae TaxID=81947 RepID=UPI00209762F9|nr:glycoside hydrolase family 32 protein [Vagococcus lutrae]MCO7151703.1 glycoside hydrolase family 32 protein [Vagococcus lutrae]MDT2813069.1 glycoside hydrolase family 32 protein [Vagococcus lutrae]MDT2819861.1 glycoside hydrolase family 32 protein [Vagococcus lutrae]MDT2844737.1 glycoside hydrolase family 32 protein [Vagococcus lutrae]WCG04298.1 glycoside hydrolase family 32 protein [Vagococcus lutrae]